MITNPENLHIMLVQSSNSQMWKSLGMLNFGDMPVEVNRMNAREHVLSAVADAESSLRLLRLLVPGR